MMSRRSAPGGRLEGMSLPVPNETRLQELHLLQQRKQEPAPGPGSYDVVSATELKPCSHSQRRRHQPQLDGPVMLQPGESSLRSQQITTTLLLRDSGVSPTAYDGLIRKDACLTRAPTPKIGTARRGGPAPLSAGQLCLSVSRSLSSGLNWMKPLPLQQLQQHIPRLSSTAGGALTRSPVGGRSSSPAGGDKQPVQCSSPGQLERVPSAAVDTQVSQAVHNAPAASGQSVSGPPQQRQQQQRQQRVRAHTPSGGHVPWQLAKQLAEWDEVVQAMAEQQQQQQQQLPQQQPYTDFDGQMGEPQGRQSPYNMTLHFANAADQNGQRSGSPAQLGRGISRLASPTGLPITTQQPGQSAAANASSIQGNAYVHPAKPCSRHDAAVVLEQQQVMQHMSAARAAEAVAQLAARRQRWQELSH